MSSTEFPVGSIIINKSGERRKVLGVCGEVRFLETVGEEKLHTPSTYSITNLEERGYVEEAPRWEPKPDDVVYFIDFFAGEVSVCDTVWKEEDWQVNALKIGRVYQTKEAAQAARERVAKALRNE